MPSLTIKPTDDVWPQRFGQSGLAAAIWPQQFAHRFILLAPARAAFHSSLFLKYTR
jgi:hypothetical protein